MRPFLFFGGRFSSKLYKIHRGQLECNQNIEKLNLQNPIWIHAASLGEFEMALPLIEELHLQQPNVPFLISFFSPSGYENAKLPPYCQKIYLGIDSPEQANKFLEALKPQKVIFVKYEIWLNHLKACHNRNIPVFYWNLILRKDHFIFSWWAKSWLSVLKQCAILFCQNSKTLELLQSRNFNNCLQTGDIRFNRGIEIQKSELPSTINEHSNGELMSWLQSGSILILGSSWPEEETMLAEVLQKTEFKQQLNANHKIIIVPHDVSVKHIRNIQQRFSAFQTQLFSEPIKRDFQILIVDKIGVLSRLYRFAKIAFIGGGFSGQLHNIIEPAAAGCFTLYGPNAKKFPESDFFEELNIGNKIHNTNELARKLLVLWGNSKPNTSFILNKDLIKNQVQQQVTNIQYCADLILE
jgi:3-deoxy-D-manno-octulosonic-acid transferase